MTNFLLKLLIDPISKGKLLLKNEQIDKNGNIISGLSPQNL